MNGNIIKQDSLLSNISNISVKIDHNRRDGSGFFNNYVRQNDNDVQIGIDALQDNDQFNHGSLIDKIMYKSKQGSNFHEPQNRWVVDNNVGGLSEQQDESVQQQQSVRQQQQSQKSQKLIQQQKHSIIKQRPILIIKQPPAAQQTQQVRRQKLIQKRLKNETKNIPKNYGKAIISFIQKYEDKVRYITEKNGVDYDDFIQELKQKKKIINTIADLRSMWVDYKYAQCMRYLSNLFLRKYALNYIFNSRICNYASHIKYRYRLCEAIKEPFSFKHIKDY